MQYTKTKMGNMKLGLATRRGECDYLIIVPEKKRIGKMGEIKYLKKYRIYKKHKS